MKGILIIDHGSMKEEANRMLECVGELVQHMAGDGVIVRVAHMEIAAPTHRRRICRVRGRRRHRHRRLPVHALARQALHA